MLIFLTALFMMFLFITKMGRGTVVTGDNVGLLLRGLKRDEVQRGQRRGKLYVVAVLGGATVGAGGVGGDQKTRPEVVDALRRPIVLLRSSHQWLRSSCLDAHPRSHFARFRYRICQSVSRFCVERSKKVFGWWRKRGGGDGDGGGGGGCG
ncbi:hypothetical protein U1Q18_031780 [Sarracenia purpurea var. burkii]